MAELFRGTEFAVAAVSLGSISDNALSQIDDWKLERNSASAATVVEVANASSRNNDHLSTVIDMDARRS